MAWNCLKIYCVWTAVTAYDDRQLDVSYRNCPMAIKQEQNLLRWVLTIFIAVVVFSSLLPWLEKLGIGRLPGDVRFKLFGRNFSFPFASTILISLFVLLLARIFK